MSPDDFPITLEEACRLYPGAAFKVSTLKAAASRGNLGIFLLGRRYHTTKASMDEWVRKCQDGQRERGCTWTQSEKSGSSGTADASTALAALKQSTQRLKGNSRTTSEGSTNRRVGQTH